MLRRGAHDVGAVEDVDLVALGVLGERDVDGVPAVAADARAADPREGEIAGRARAADVHRAQRAQAEAAEGVRGVEVGGVADVAVGGAAAPGVGEADLVGAHVDAREGAVEQNEAGAGGDGRAHGALGAGLAAQEERRAGRSTAR